MKIEEGKFYISETGLKIGPMRRQSLGSKFVSDLQTGMWFESGKATIGGVGADLIDEWSNPAPEWPLDAPQPAAKRLIDTDSATRKKYPMAAGLLDYFPDALAEVAKVSYIGNEKHNPGEPMHHARGKSMDHADCIVRHLVGRGGFDGDLRESAALAWRALALLQEELEREQGLSLPRGARAAK